MEQEVNQYAASASDDRDYVDNVSGSSLGCLHAFFGIVMLLVTLGAVGWIGTTMFRSANPPKPLFHYGDVVEVIDGFHKGRRGEVVDCKDWNLSTSPLGCWQYLVKFERFDSTYLDESQLRKVNDDR